MLKGFLRGPLGLLTVTLGVALAACGDGARDLSGKGAPGAGAGAGFADPNAAFDGTLVLDPADKEIDVSGAQPVSVPYKVSLVAKTGERTDVTDRVVFSEEGADVGFTVGTFKGATFTAAGDRVGRTTIRARLDERLEGKTSLSLKAKRVIVAAGADPSAASKFTGADTPSASPSLVYPADGVIVPPNMNDIEFHYVPKPGQSLFELGFESPYLDLKVYVGCQTLGAGCTYSPDKTVWNLIASSGRDVDPVAYRLRATSAGGGAVGRSADRHIGFGRESITGGVYYWNAGAGQTKRYEFGVSGQKAETFLSPANAGSLFCVGCHSISRDGRYIAVGLDIPGTASKTLTVGTRQQVFARPGASCFAFSPDSSQIMTSNGQNIVWRTTQTAAPIKEPVVAQGTMPDWSADGKQLVYAKSTDPMLIGAPAISKGTLEVISLNGAAWSAATVLVPRTGSENNYYPAFSPDSAWVLFNRSPSGKNSMGDDSSGGNTPSGVADGQLWIVPAAGGPAKRLDAASVPGKDTFDSWPKWAPVVQTYRGKRLMWFTFSSRRAYGLRTNDGDNTQLWMAAFDPEKGAADPSLPAFWVPFQELSSGNHIAQWVTRVERQPCGGPGACASGEQCIEGRCVPAIK